MRDIDRIIKCVQEHPWISPIHKQVLVTRIEKLPTREEVEEARRIVYPEEAS